MGINNGRLHGVGARPQLGRQITGPVTINTTPGANGLVIQDTTPGRSGGANLMNFVDFFGAPIFFVNAGALTSGGACEALMDGDRLNMFGPNFGGTNIAIQGFFQPPGILAPGGQTLYFGNGDPNSAYPKLTGAVNDQFWNFGGTTSTTHMYRCSTAGTPGVWTGFA